MKMRLSKRRNSGLTLFEAALLIAIVLLFMFIFFSGNMMPGAMARAQRINCVSNLKQIGLASFLWANEHGGEYPMQISVTNGGAMELVATGNVTACFLVMSNELSTPKILYCPADTIHTQNGEYFRTSVTSSNISYFLSLDAYTNYPQRLLSGDDNLAANGVLAKPGIFQFPSKVVFWGPGRHGDVPRHFWMKPPAHFVGNISFSDGSVAEVSDLGLEQALVLGLATNRFAIP
jgi:hypothetical protein